MAAIIQAQEWLRIQTLIVEEGPAVAAFGYRRDGVGWVRALASRIDRRQSSGVVLLSGPKQTSPAQGADISLRRHTSR